MWLGWEAGRECRGCVHHGRCRWARLQAAEGSDKTPMRDHALGKNPDLDNFLINWIRLLEAYQVRAAGDTSLPGYPRARAQPVTHRPT